MTSVARVALIVVCGVLAAAFALGTHQAHDTAAVASLLSRTAPLTRAQVAHASDLISSASTLNPDRETDILRGRLALATGEPARARAILLRAIHAEPENIEPLVYYLRASAGNARATIAALIGIRRLEPLVPGSSH